jgi:hypothetical protein
MPGNAHSVGYQSQSDSDASARGKHDGLGQCLLGRRPWGDSRGRSKGAGTHSDETSGPSPRLRLYPGRSGGPPEQGAQIAQAGIDALKK